VQSLRASLADALAPASPEADVGRRLALRALWFTAAVGVIRTLLIAPRENRGTDFEPIWAAVQRYVHGVPVYNEDYTTLDPHYLYSPGANVVLAPLALFGSFSVARGAMIAATALSVIAAIWLAARMLTRCGALPLTLLTVGVFFNTAEPVHSTIKYTNINGFLLLVMILFVWFTLALHHGPREPMLRQFARPEMYLAGVLLGYAVTIKPHFIVLTALPVLLLQWPVLLVAAGVYALLMCTGWATTSEAQWYTDRLLPYLRQPRGYDNGSLRAVVGDLGFGTAAQYAAMGAVLVAVVTAVVALFPLRRRNTASWAFTTLGVLFAGVFLAGGLLQGYYAMWLIPMALTIVRPHTPMRLIIMWVAVLLTLSGLSGLFTHGVLADSRGSLGPTVGWVLIPFIVAVWAVRERAGAGRVR